MLGEHGAYIIACYGVSLAVLGGLGLWNALEGRAVRRRLAELEARGVRRRSDRAGAARREVPKRDLPEKVT